MEIRRVGTNRALAVLSASPHEFQAILSADLSRRARSEARLISFDLLASGRFFLCRMVFHPSRCRFFISRVLATSHLLLIGVRAPLILNESGSRTFTSHGAGFRREPLALILLRNQQVFTRSTYSNSGTKFEVRRNKRLPAFLANNLFPCGLRFGNWICSLAYSCGL